MNGLAWNILVGRQHPPSGKLLLVLTYTGHYVVCSRSASGLYFLQNEQQATLVSDQAVEKYMVIK